MPTIIVTKPFPFAVDGNHVVHIEAGEQEVSERCAIVAVDHLKVAALAGKEAVNDRPRGSKKPSAR